MRHRRRRVVKSGLDGRAGKAYQRALEAVLAIPIGIGIGYFVDEPCWGRGIAGHAVRLLERVCFRELGLRRLEILMARRNKASRRVAEKCGYRREVLLKNRIVIGGKHLDALLYAKTRP